MKNLKHNILFGLSSLFIFLSFTGNAFAATWVPRSEMGAKNWIGYAMSADKTYQTAAVQNGYLYVSSDSGATWTQKNVYRQWIGVAMSSDGKYQTAFNQNSGVLSMSTDYGQTWSDNSLAGWWNSVAISGDGKYQTAVSKVGNAYIYVSSDYGITWTAMTDAGSRYWSAVAISGDGKYQTAVSYDYSGNIFTSSDYGLTWAANPGPGSRRWVNIAMSSDGKYQTAVGQNSNIYVSSDYGVTWNPRDSVRPYWESALGMSSDGMIQTASAWLPDGYEYLFTSFDYGDTWIMQDAPGSANGYYTLVVSADGTYQVACNWGEYLYDAHFSFDTVPPVISSVIISSNNASTTLAKVGDTITLSFVSSEELGQVSAVIAGHNVPVVSTSPTAFTAEYTMQEGDIEGEIPFTIDSADLSGNQGVQITGSAVNSKVIFDKTAPVITILGNNPLEVKLHAKYKDDGATALDSKDGDMTASIIVSDLVDVTVAGDYAVTYSVSDLAGNLSTAVRNVTVAPNNQKKNLKI